MMRHAPAVVRNLLFCNEAALSGKLSGSSDFAAYFMSQGIRDEQGRSLREFDGEDRLFRYLCGYMIYTDSFNMLPYAFKREVYRQLHEILTSIELNEDFSHLTQQDKNAVYEILKSTIPELSRLWD